MSQQLASVAWCAVALPAFGSLQSGSGLEFADAFAALALAAKQALLEIADLGLRHVELSTKRCLALRGRYLCQRQCRVPRRLALLGALAQLHHESIGAVLELLQSPPARWCSDFQRLASITSRMCSCLDSVTTTSANGAVLVPLIAEIASRSIATASMAAHGTGKRPT